MAFFFVDGKGDFGLGLQRSGAFGALRSKLKMRALVGGNERIRSMVWVIPPGHDHQRVSFHHPSVEPSLRPNGQLVIVFSRTQLQGAFVEEGSGDGVSSTKMTQDFDSMEAIGGTLPLKTVGSRSLWCRNAFLGAWCRCLGFARFGTVLLRFG